MPMKSGAMKSTSSKRALWVVVSFALGSLSLGCSETVEQCLGLEDPNAACPTAEEAEDMWRGTETCSDPVVVVRKVVGEPERSEVKDTGVLLTPISCCYEVVGRAKEGEACVE
jgi:hypothetical protein